MLLYFPILRSLIIVSTKSAHPKMGHACDFMVGNIDQLILKIFRGSYILNDFKLTVNFNSCYWKTPLYVTIMKWYLITLAIKNFHELVLTALRKCLIKSIWKYYFILKIFYFVALTVTWNEMTTNICFSLSSEDNNAKS